MVMSNNNNVHGGRQQQQQGANTAMTMATGALSSNGGGIQKKGPWSASEDAVLVEYVREYGEGNWNAVQKHTGLQRCGKSCRLRWANHLRPNLKKGTFSLDEERLIIDLHSKLGNKWARISSYLPGRTDNEIKNYWNTRVKRRIRQGLPLYPNEVQRQPSPPPPPLHPPTLPLSLPKTSPPTLPLFNHVSFSSPIFPPFNQRPPHLLASHPLKRCSTNSYMGTNPIFPPTQVGMVRKMEIEGSSLIGFGFDPARKLETECDFSFGNFELPSYQLIGHKNNNSSMNGSCIKVGNQVKVDPYVGRANNTGLLDDLLQEAQHKVGLKKEKEDYGGFQWDVSSSENSSNGHKKEEMEEQKMKFDSQDLSNILELIPSLVEVPSWSTNDGGAESSAAQSAAVSTDDNYNGFNDDLMPQPPSFAAEGTINYDDHDDGNWNLGSYSWNNLPKFC